MQDGGRGDIEAEGVAVRLAQDLTVARLGVIAYEVVDPAITRAWDAPTTQQRVTPPVQHGEDLIGALDLSVDLPAALDLRRREVVVLQQVICQRLVARVDVILQA